MVRTFVSHVVVPLAKLLFLFLRILQNCTIAIIAPPSFDRQLHSQLCSALHSDGGTEGSPRATNFLIGARLSPFSRRLLLSPSRVRACCPSYSLSPSFAPLSCFLVLASSWRGEQSPRHKPPFAASQFAIEISFAVAAVATRRVSLSKIFWTARKRLRYNIISL